MNSFPSKLDKYLIPLFKGYGLDTLRISLGIVFFWFGFLKFFPNVSPAESLATDTINVITFGMIPPYISIKLLALWETLIGIGFLCNIFQRTTLLLLWLQMIGAWMPLIIFPERMFVYFPFILTLEGQYILKNMILISSTFVLGAYVKSNEYLTSEE
jgi:uncharacterized membrane protein YphA (DoxX/SURF4 family)